MEQSETINELATALCKAQSKMKGALKDAQNPYFESMYADLSSVWEACRGPLAENGLSVVQTTRAVPGEVCLVTTLLHSSGQWIRGELQMKPVKPDPQAMGSCITYARRYALAAIVGVAPEDDDGNGASQPVKRDKTPVNTALPTPVGQPTQGKVKAPQEANQSLLSWASTKGWSFDDVSRYAKLMGLSSKTLTDEQNTRLHHVIGNFSPAKAMELGAQEVAVRGTP